MFAWGDADKGKLGLGKLYVDEILMPTEIQANYPDGSELTFQCHTLPALHPTEIPPINRQSLTYQTFNQTFVRHKKEEKVTYTLIDVVKCTETNTFFRTSDGRLFVCGEGPLDCDDASTDLNAGYSW